MGPGNFPEGRGTTHEHIPSVNAEEPRGSCLLLGVATPVAADTILVFGQNGGGNLVAGNEVLGTTVLSATNVPLTITTLNEGGVNLTAFFQL